MSRIIRIVGVALVSLAIGAPVALAKPMPAASDAVAVQPQDLRNPDQRAPATPVQDLRNADQRAPGTTSAPATAAPVVHTEVPRADDGGTSPLVYVLPSLALVLIAAAAAGYARTVAHPRRSHARV